MDGMVVTFQHVEPTGQAYVRRAKDRKIVQVFNLVVNIKLVEDELQPGHELAREFSGRKLPGTKLCRDVIDCDC